MPEPESDALSDPVSVSIESSFAALRRWGLKPALMQQAIRAAREHPASRLLRVTQVQRESLLAHDGLRERPLRLQPSLRHALDAEGDAIAVGDWVLAADDGFGGLWAHQRLAPLSQLARRLHDGRDKVTRVIIVSNVDTALLVMGLDADFSPRRLERFMALARLAGVEPVVVLSKADGAPDAELRRKEVAALLGGVVPVVALDGRDARAADVLAPWLCEGDTLVLLGSSGAGKSTLTNTLAGAEVADTGGQRKGDGRGRHTTTARTLHGLRSGACLIDTPGLRTLRLDGDPQALDAVFDDIGALAQACRFRDCRHEGEPGCAVREGVAPERLKNFQKLQREATRDQLTALERKAQVQQWKARSRAARVRMDAKRG
jgi:ribosome biogenesis GTPase / thiamine phosphate phosphatase